MRNYKMRGGNANTLPLEYFGGNSGRYSVNPASPGECAYGQVVPQSFGMPIEGANAVGPNLCVYPNSSPLQTGGARRRRRVAKKSSKKRSLRKRSLRKRVSKSNRKSKRRSRK